MARCLELADFSVEEEGGTCLVTLEAWQVTEVEAFEDILKACFPGSRFRRIPQPSQTGIIALQQSVRLRGQLPPGGSEEVERLLSLVSKSLTIEDSLEESHALAYHQDQDEATGGLKPSALGRLVSSAKYKGLRRPREQIGEALADFIRTHPRYARAEAIACAPSHETGRSPGLAGRLVKQLTETLGIRRVEIIRASNRPPQKGIIDEDRQAGVRKRLANQRGSMRVDDHLDGAAVIVVDDLYGSGATMEEAARALKEAGAREVLGLTATKQRLYGGVRLGSRG